jgi:UPF0755 protein
MFFINELNGAEGSLKLELVQLPPMRRVLGLVFGVLFALLLVGAASAAYLLSSTGAPKATLEVKPGMGVTEIAAQLERQKLVRSSFVFGLVMRYTGADRRIREGFYDLSGAQDNFSLARSVAGRGRPREVRLVIPEGWRLSEIVTRLEGLGLASRAEFETAFRDTKLLSYTTGAPNLEGFLFPATYPFRPETGALEVAKTLTARFAQEVTPERLKRLGALKLSVYQWVTLASIVQVEAGKLSEMPLIAGIFLNRLEVGMPLQSDPTIAYGLNKKLPQLNRRAGDFTNDTPYNSYTRKGLPPTPIANPGAAALEAVLNSSRNAPSGKPWLYFVHGLKGEFRPNTDFQSHLRDVEKYR